MLETKLPQKKLVEKIVSSIDEVKGIDVDLLDLRKINNTVCRFFIICTGTSNTHVSAITSSIKKNVSKELKEKPYSMEGLENQEWVLIDYVDVVVHVFQQNIREFYDIENLWGDAKISRNKIKV
ncbi:MAG: ribosome silencing factor [Flavobacteriales bacterium]|jgi:ribosome-associated protein|nr:ribosome silencing factor [Flavobacteriales bacterium]|tara:strand:- start:339 stop:710 length:372 start_codon:yes stop_codon:yes gene_type:complete